MKKLFLIFAVLIATSNTSLAKPPCELSMTYKDVGKPDYMAPSPNNSGLYKALYSEAAKRVGCKLVIKRFPKKRTLRQLQSGKIDIYPSTGFDEKRSLFLFYTPNGLFRDETYYGLTPLSVSHLESIGEIKNHGLTWIIEAGRTTVEKAKRQQLPYQALVGLIGIGRHLTMPLPPHHQAYGSRTMAVRLIELFAINKFRYTHCHKVLRWQCVS
ncbi:hypothetical protein [Alkalimarinus coralli]|uniref:hypothetical protein n=1 Tax=Alkalimarinus coralli TaxID=2935863 RepID=UPI00202B3DAF|nr:hypothetical protein [Alkalimarinus coralli]